MPSVQPVSLCNSQEIGRLTTELRLMMYFSRVSLEPEQLDLIRQTAPKIDDWNRFAIKATWHLIAPLCLYHLKHFKSARWFEAARAALLPSARILAAKSLGAGFANQAFLADLTGNNVPFLIVKGRAIGSRYYPDNSLRPSRDIDIWAHLSERISIIQRAQQEGYVIYLFGRPFSIEELVIHIEKRESDIGLVHPNGTKIELDRNLDKRGEIFKFEEMLARADTCVVDGIECKTLSTTDCFIYCCLHHNRHGFLRLIWLADLNAIQQAPDFDANHVMARALELGLGRTVEACLAFCGACATEDPIADVAGYSEALDVLNTCIAISDFHHASEVREFISQRDPDCLYDWQLQELGTKTYLQQLSAFLYKKAMYFKPRVEDYRALPLPLSLYYVYYFLRPWFVLARKAGILKS